MSFCNLCQSFDIRALLLKSTAQIPQATGLTNRNGIDADDYRLPLPHLYTHHRDIVALKRSAEQGCTLCDLLWSTWFATLPKNDMTDDTLNETFQGQVYVGCSGWTTSIQGGPYVTLSQQDSAGRSRTLCYFEAYAERGKKTIAVPRE